MTYTTVQGDAFDQVAKAVYGNERRMDALLEANPAHREMVVFPAGVSLAVPELAEKERQRSALPPWER